MNCASWLVSVGVTRSIDLTHDPSCRIALLSHPCWVRNNFIIQSVLVKPSLRVSYYTLMQFSISIYQHQVLPWWPIFAGHLCSCRYKTNLLWTHLTLSQRNHYNYAWKIPRPNSPTTLCTVYLQRTQSVFPSYHLFCFSISLTWNEVPSWLNVIASWSQISVIQ